MKANAMNSAVIRPCLGLIGLMLLLWSARVLAADPQSSEKSVAEDQPRVQQITGVVLTPDGKPAAGAKVALMANVYTGTDIATVREQSVIVAQGKTNDDGRFEIRIEKLPDGQIDAVFILAAAEGYGLGWTRPNFDDWPQDYQIQLPPEVKLQGKLLTADGQPGAHVAVRLEGLRKKNPVEGVFFAPDTDDLQKLFTTQFVTDERGQIAASGIPSDVKVGFRLTTSGLSYTYWDWNSNAIDPVFTLPETIDISGTVTATDTGQLIAYTIVSARDAKTTTNADGNFRLQSARTFGVAQTISITARPPAGLPYLERSLSLRRHPGVTEEKVQFTLDRGALITGEVLEEGSGQPVSYARIFATTRFDPKSFQSIGTLVAFSDPDGKFGFVAKPGTIDVSVEACSCDFVMRPVQIQRNLGRTTTVFASRNVFAHVTLDVTADTQGNVKFLVARGVTVRGEIVGSDGKTPAEVAMRRPYPQYSGFTDNYRFDMLTTHGHFAVHGVSTDGEMPAVFLDAAGDEGKYETVRGAETGALKKITLEKCGSATVRFVDPDGKPVAAKQQTVSIVFGDQTKPAVGIAPAEAVLPFSFPNWEVDFEKFQNQATDDQGRLNLTHLVPGLTYMVRTGNLRPDGLSENMLIRVQSGQHVDAPDIVVQKPPVPRRAAVNAKDKATGNAAESAPSSAKAAAKDDK